MEGKVTKGKQLSQPQAFQAGLIFYFLFLPTEAYPSSSITELSSLLFFSSLSYSPLFPLFLFLCTLSLPVKCILKSCNYFIFSKQLSFPLKFWRDYRLQVQRWSDLHLPPISVLLSHFFSKFWSFFQVSFSMFCWAMIFDRSSNMVKIDTGLQDNILKSDHLFRFPKHDQKHYVATTVN